VRYGFVFAGEVCRTWGVCRSPCLEFRLCSTLSRVIHLFGDMQPLARADPVCLVQSVFVARQVLHKEGGSIMATIALVTYRDLPQLTPEDQLVCLFLQTLGVNTQAVIWDAPDILWDTYQAVVVRSCWDYHVHPSRFITWLRHLERLQIPLWNPAPILQWNLHKTYLRELQTQGIAIPPTCWLTHGSKAELATILAGHGWKEAVIKPAISATAYHTWRTTREQTRQDQSQFAALLQHADLLVQQFMDPVVTSGEWSFVFFRNSTAMRY
jgi:hypothetical protein